MHTQNLGIPHLALTLFISISISTLSFIATSPVEAAPKKSTHHPVKPAKTKSVPTKLAPTKPPVKKTTPIKKVPTVKPSDVMVIEGGTTETDGSITVGNEEVPMDLEIDLGADAGGSGPSFDNPYNFERNPLWILLPALTLAFLALHLLPVPKRKLKKLTPQTKLFSGIDGKDPTKSAAITKTFTKTKGDT